MTRNVSCLSVIGGILCALLAAAATSATFKDDLGYTKLQSELGTSTPDGSGITVATLDVAYGDPGYTEFYPNLNVQHPVDNAWQNFISEHDTTVLRFYVGDLTSIAPNVPTVLAYSMTHEGGWILGNANSILNLQGYNTTISGGPLPGYSAARVTNVTSQPAATSATLRRLDWYIATDEVVYITPHLYCNCASGGADGDAMAYNTIDVGLSKQSSVNGYNINPDWTSPTESIYLQGQHPWPTLVAPGNAWEEFTASSNTLSTPVAASAAVLLVQKGHGDSALSTDPVSTSFTNRAGVLIRNAERVEVIKAAMMAGALRDGRHTADDGTQKYLLQETSGGPNATAYRQLTSDQTDNGLDKRMGAGQLNVRNSYYIIAAREQNSIEDGGPGSGTAQRGFDYDPHFGGLTNAQATYVLPTSATPRLLTASLVWNITVVGDTQPNPGVFDGATSLNDLKLSVIDTTATPTVVASSDSAIENTENIWFELQANHAYKLLVERGNGSPAFDWDYGLAWQAVPDTDADGVPDEQDNCKNVANGPFILGQAGISQYDSDGDGYGNRCDGDLNNNGVTNAQDYAIFRTKLGTTDAVADLSGNGTVNAQDYAIFRGLLGSRPGPSGLCAATPAMPCTPP